jgi:hypothetical protein
MRLGDFSGVNGFPVQSAQVLRPRTAQAQVRQLETPGRGQLLSARSDQHPAIVEGEPDGPPGLAGVLDARDERHR